MVSAVEGQGESRFTRETGVAGQIATLAEPVLQDLGLRLVRVLISARDGNTVQIMAERPDGTMTVEDCSKVSRHLSPLLDAHDPMSGAYRLEVSSPGIDRPLVRAGDFERWTGCEAKIELKAAIDGRRRFRGFIDGFDQGEVRLEITLKDEHGVSGSHVIGLPADLIDTAKLVLTDELVLIALKAQSPEEARIAEAAERQVRSRARKSGVPTEPLVKVTAAKSGSTTE